MKINFILPGIIKIPIGGAKVIYRYAYELSRLGHEVCIISPKREGNKIYHFIKKIGISMRDYYQKVENQPYYTTPKGVKHCIVPTPTIKYIPDGDVIIATGWQTAFWVDELSELKGNKYYFIQCMDMQQLDDKLIKMDLVKQCAISHYGEELLLAMGQKTDSLEPQHTFVPWITFNDVSMLYKI